MALCAENLEFGAVRGASITIEPGEIVGLQGPSGVGKTTLARLLSGHLLPKAGSVTVDGQRVPGRGFCPVQLIQQHPEQAIDPRWRLHKVLEGIDQEVIDLLGIKPEWLSRRALEVSGGQLQRLNIARAFDPRSRYVLADEITAMLDGISQAQIWRSITDLAHQRRIGMLVISHNPDLLAQVADRRLQLRDGRIYSGSGVR